jgi:hypothetical protein
MPFISVSFVIDEYQTALFTGAVDAAVTGFSDTVFLTSCCCGVAPTTMILVVNAGRFTGCEELKGFTLF